MRSSKVGCIHTLLIQSGSLPTEAAHIAAEALVSLPDLMTAPELASLCPNLERWSNEGGPGRPLTAFERALAHHAFVKAASIAYQADHPALGEVLFQVAVQSAQQRNSGETAVPWSAVLTASVPGQAL